MVAPGNRNIGTITPLYAVTIHRCIESGELDKMRSLVDEAETFVKEHGNVAAALDALKAEIAKLERRG